MINSPMLFPYKNIVNACIATTTQLNINKISSRFFFHFHFLPNSPFLIYQHFLKKFTNHSQNDINALIRILKAKLSKNTL